jgi:hypothetical protein
MKEDKNYKNIPLQRDAESHSDPPRGAAPLSGCMEYKVNTGSLSKCKWRAKI